MPTFTPGQSVTARATLPVKPAGLACQAELYLAGKVATSGKVSFTSTGADQQVTLPITMPISGTYQVLLDITTDGQLIGAFYATETVIIAVPSYPFTYTFSCSSGGCPGAPGFSMAQMSGTIRNNHNVQVSQNVAVKWSRWSRTYVKWMEQNGIVPMSPCKLNPFPLTLNPGQMVNYSYSGYCWPAGYDFETCEPMLFKNYDYYFWLEDEAGGKSNVVMISL